jgi:hypothetical protein
VLDGPEEVKLQRALLRLALRFAPKRRPAQVGRLRQRAVCRTRAGAAVSRPVYPPNRHLKSPPCLAERTRSNYPHGFTLDGRLHGESIADTDNAQLNYPHIQDS